MVSSVNALWKKVTVLSLLVHVTIHPPGSGVQVKVTEVVSICSLKVTTTFAPNNTPVEPFAGDVVVISGPTTSTVVKYHGFGLEPLIKLFPLISFATVILNVYVVELPKSVCE